MKLLVISRFWKQLFVFVVPVVFLPLPLVIGTKPACCAYVIALMAIFWLTEVIPMPIVSLLPVILFPMMGIQSSKDVCQSYFEDSVMLFVGSLIVAVAVEETNLHKRLALRVLMLVGSQPRWLMFGFMCIAGFLSMWMSNTATTAMITPISEAVILELFRRKRTGLKAEQVTIVVTPPAIIIRDALSKSLSLPSRPVQRDSLTPLIVDDSSADGSTSSIHKASTASSSVQQGENASELSIHDLTPEELRLAKGMILCVAYAANIGGTATLTGTLPNIVLKGQIDILYGPNTGVNFATFLLYSFPGALISLLVAFTWLQWIFIAKSSCKRTKEPSSSNTVLDVKGTIREKYDELGPMGFGETSVMCLFVTLILAWMFRDPQFVAGWQDWFPKNSVSDATPAILISFLLFIWPSSLFGSATAVGSSSPVSAILSWKAMKKRFPWDVFLLLGGAIALADGTQISGLTGWFKEQMHHFAALPPYLVAILICLVIATVTEFASNGAVATIFLPVVAKLAEVSDVNPLYYMIPTTIACSMAFMLPVATPPNAIAFGYGYLKVWDMIKAGTVVTILGLLILLANLHTMGILVFGVLSKPSWLIVDQVLINSDTFSFNASLHNVAAGFPV